MLLGNVLLYSASYSPFFAWISLGLDKVIIRELPEVILLNRVRGEESLRQLFGDAFKLWMPLMTICNYTFTLVARHEDILLIRFWFAGTVLYFPQMWHCKQCFNCCLLLAFLCFSSMLMTIFWCSWVVVSISSPAMAIFFLPFLLLFARASFSNMLAPSGDCTIGVMIMVVVGFWRCVVWQIGSASCGEYNYYHQHQMGSWVHWTGLSGFWPWVTWAMWLRVCVGGGVINGGGFGDDSLSESGAGVTMVDGR